MDSTVQPSIKAIETGLQSDRTTQIADVHMSAQELCVQVSSQAWDVNLKFEAFYGFRVLDELDLTEFWTQCTLMDGWLFEVRSGGWKDLELQRPAFLSGQNEWVKEYLIVGLNECVSVLAKELPSITPA